MRKLPEEMENRVRIEVLLVILATGAGVIESLIPSPIPFIKPGLANVVTVAAIVKYGLWTGLRINILRSTGAALFIGTLATPTYLLSLSGGIASALVMGIIRRIFSVTGMSISGSLASLFIQLLTASILLPGLPFESLLIPISIWGTLSGTITGIVAIVILRRGFPWIHNSGVDSTCLPE
ncbi:MAG: Gx transporter family protein [Candidatus Aegiribacteria sp.]|nr:Gx transporter family protein [Candidatus Aegiribacteria sp.]